MYLPFCPSTYILLLHSLWNWNSNWNASLHVFKELFLNNLTSLCLCWCVFFRDFFTLQTTFYSVWLLKHWEIKKKTKSLACCWSTHATVFLNSASLGQNFHFECPESAFLFLHMDAWWHFVWFLHLLQVDALRFLIS